jgi:tRNA/rRNA methyltransferase
MMKETRDTGNAAESHDNAQRASAPLPTSEPSGRGPAIILVGPQLPENIGFAARAMANFGLSELRLVRPREAWPNEKARAAAAGADQVIDAAAVYDELKGAVADLNYVIATTARPRGMTKPVFAPDSAAQELARRIASAERTGILFGPERSGLDNEPISLADAILTAPVDPAFASLSLPQAVLLVSYEWLKAKQAIPTLGRATTFDGPALEGLDQSGDPPAGRGELFALFDHIESELDHAGFLRPPEKRPTMVRAIRNMFHRMSMTEQDVRTWRGIVAALAGTRKARDSEGS